jgi:uncharacterized protein
MLVQFSVANYLSFKSEATLSLLASKLKSKNKSLDKNSTFESIHGLMILRTAVLYGANASGKSNIFKALRVMKTLVINSSKESQADEEIDVMPFLLNTVSKDQPSRFEIIFIHNKCLFEYKFSCTATHITEESLSIKGEDDIREKMLFERSNEVIKVHKSFSEGEGLERRTRANALFVSVCANFDGSISSEIIKWFRSIRVISGINDFGTMGFTAKKLQESESHSKILKILDVFDIGISNIRVSDPKDNVPNELAKDLRELFEKKHKSKFEVSFESKSIVTEHHVFDDAGKQVGIIDFNLEKNESEGTKKLIALSAPFIDALENSYILFLDELDARLHPLLSLQIVNLFNCHQKNSGNAQLITATHNTNLLDKEILRRDQVWLTSKNSRGESTLNSLAEYKVRNDASFEKDYMSGKYGGIPLLGNLDNFLE